MWCPIGIPFHGNGGYGDGRCGCKPLFQIVIFWLTFSQVEPPAVIVDYDRDMIRIVERRRRAIEGGIIEVPLRRSDLPDEPREIAPVFVVADAAAFRGEIKLVPPLQLSLRRQRRLVRCLAADQITAHRDQRLAAFWPQHSDVIRDPPSPIEAREN